MARGARRRKTETRARSTPRLSAPSPQAGPARRRRPELLLVGHDRARARVARRLRGLKARLRRRDWSSELLSEVGAHTVALILVAPLEMPSMAEAVRLVRATPAGRDIPVVVVEPDEQDDAAVREAYVEGATAVFHWPREARFFADVLVELLGIARARGPASEADVALGRTVRAYLRLVALVTSGVRVTVRGAVVHLSGSVDAYWKKRRVREVVGVVPGVRGVVLDDLNVIPLRPVSDRELRKAVLALLRVTSEIDESTLSVTVQNGHVHLVGTVADRAELNRVVRLLGDVRGVREVETLATIWPDQKRADHVLARRLARRIVTVAPDADVAVAVFAGVAVLTGTVERLADRHRIADLVSEDSSTERVIDKIRVA